MNDIMANDMLVDKSKGVVQFDNDRQTYYALMGISTIHLWLAGWLTDWRRDIQTDGLAFRTPYPVIIFIYFLLAVVGGMWLN